MFDCTGSEGYIGRHVVDFLEKTNNEIMTVDVVPSSRKNANHFQEDFLQNAEDKDLYTKLGSPDAVIHLAWRDGFNYNSNEHLKNLNNHYLYLKNMIDEGYKYMFYGWEQMKKFIRGHYPDVEIISVNPVGLKGMFKDIYTDADSNINI